MNTRKSTASLALLLAAGFGLSACGSDAANDAKETAQDTVASATAAAASASEAVTPGLTDAQKEELTPFVRDFFSTARSFEAPSDAPEDINALTEKLQIEGEPETIREIAEKIEASNLTEEELQRLDEYFTDLDPTADMFDRSDITTGESIALGMINVTLGMIFSILDEGIVDSLEVDTEKVEFGDDTATTSAESFTVEGVSASESASSTADQMGLEMATTFFDDVTFKYVDDAWKIDANSYVDAIDREAASS